MTEFNESSKKIGNEPNHILEIIESIFAKDPKRDIIFKQLIDSSRFANLISELSWSVTLYKNGFRMNVGPVEALLYFDGIISINFLAQKENDYNNENFRIIEYKSVHEPVTRFDGTPDEYIQIKNDILYLHLKFIENAARNTKGEPRKTPYRKSHCKELIDYCDWQLDSESSADESFLPGNFEAIGNEIFIEGAKQTKLVSTYERNSKARKICIRHYGSKCSICGFDFGIQFGKIGEGFIHVHHIVPVSQIGEEYEIDPITDLRPLCANCHAMIHAKWPPFTITEIEKFRSDSLQLEEKPT